MSYELYPDRALLMQFRRQNNKHINHIFLPENIFLEYQQTKKGIRLFTKTFLLSRIYMEPALNYEGKRIGDYYSYKRVICGVPDNGESSRESFNEYVKSITQGLFADLDDVQLLPILESHNPAPYLVKAYCSYGEIAEVNT